ncbi:type IV secretory system conjugative DNA transfer family protein [Actinoalloteichus caeruleus]|uniref:type IV secretory system conjugative DNA transfer family protein n=1 Tax=Actinoalloteichus cyanogriseus TaxID=2893586 RepID=UPI003BB8F7E5
MFTSSWSPHSFTAPTRTTADSGLGGWVGDYLRDPGGTTRTVLGRLGGWLVEWGPVVGPLVFAAFGVLLVVRSWWQRRHQRRLMHDDRVVTVLAPPAVDSAGGAALWSNLVGLLRPTLARLLGDQPHLVWEYLFSETGVVLRVWVPGVVPPGLVERAVEAAWPGAHTRTEPATPPLPEAAERPRVLVAGQLRLARSEALPIRTDFDVDPLRALIGAPVGLGPGEHACVQVLARPVTGRRVARARRAARRLHTGRAARPLGALLDLLTPGGTPHRRVSSTRPGGDPQTALDYAAQNRVVVAKQRGAQYETVLRYAVTADVPPHAAAEEVRQARQTARGRAHALAAAFAAYTEHNHYTRRRLRRPQRTLSDRCLGRGDLLSVPELAALAHLPVDEATPGVQRAGARALPPPPGVPAPGPQAKPLGSADSGHRRPVAVWVPDTRHHLHVLGATGSGKSTLLANMILDDAEAGRGLVVVDPKGDLVTDVLSRLPAAAADRLVLFDADSRLRPPCLNPLDGGETDLVVDNIVSVFRRVYSAFWGPRTDDLLRAACLTLRTQEGVTTLADLPRLLSEPAFRTRVTAGVTDPVLRGFWAWYADLTDASRSQVVSPLMNKLRGFLLRPFVRHALTAGKSTVDLDQVLDGGICLVRIPKGSLGEETTRLVGSLIVARAWQATTGRAHTPQAERRDASMVIDECHNFLNLPYSLEDMLAEARGFRVSMTLAHQHLGQLPRDLREGISTNARNKIFFTSSPEDAGDLARHTAPRLSDHDLAHLGAYHAATRLVVAGENTPPFTLTTNPLPPAVPGRARKLRRALRDRPATTPAAERQPGATDDLDPHDPNARSAPYAPRTDPRRVR